MKSSAKIVYHDKSILLKARQDADAKFSDQYPQSKNLYVLKTYKDLGGKITFSGQSAFAQVQEGQAFAVAMKMWLSSKAEKWPELFEIEEIDLTKIIEEKSTDTSIASILSAYSENTKSIEDFLSTIQDIK